MPLLGRAAMVLTFDIEEDAIREHDDWHTHEHLPERLSIPGFLRGTRSIATSDGPRYLVVYEAERIETLGSAAYLERLNDPTPWTRRMMPHYRGMTRGLCEVAHSHGLGAGHFSVMVRFKPVDGEGETLDRWLDDEMRELCMQPGLGSAHLLRSGLSAEMTAEQRIRGADAGVDWVLWVTGYDEEALAALERTRLVRSELERRGATGVAATRYRVAYTLSAADVAGRQGGAS